MELKGLHIYFAGEPQRFLRNGVTEQVFAKYLLYTRYIKKENKSRETFWEVSILTHLLERSMKSKFMALAVEKTKGIQDTSLNYGI